MDEINFVVKETNLDKTNIQNTLQLFNEGATIPFIARYRKERTGGLDEIQIEQIREFSKNLKMRYNDNKPSLKQSLNKGKSRRY